MVSQDNQHKHKALLSGLSPAEKFLFSGITLLIIGLGFQFIGAVLAAWFYGFRITEIFSLSAFSDPNYVAASKLMQIIGSTGTFILPAFLFSFFFTGTATGFFNFREPVTVIAMVLTVAMMVAVIPFINYLAEFNLNMKFPLDRLDLLFRNLENEAEKVMTAFTGTKSIGGLLVNMLMIGVIAALGEELIFRGIIQRLLVEWFKNAFLAIFLTAVLFSAFHFQFFSFLPRFLLGVILGYLYYIGRSIWYPIVAHFVNNALGVIYYYFYSRGAADDVWEEIGTSRFMPTTALISMLLFVLFFILWYVFVKGIIRLPQHGRTGKD